MPCTRTGDADAPTGGFSSSVLPGGRPVEPAMLSFLMQQPGVTLVSDLKRCLGHLDAVLGCIRPLEQERPLRHRSR